MSCEILLFSLQFLIAFNSNNYATALPMFGQNVQNVSDTEYPYIVSITRTYQEAQNVDFNHICTGILITRQDVLTGANCFAGTSVNNIAVAIGSTNLRYAIRFEILWWIDVLQWQQLNNVDIILDINDIANIRLRQEVPENIPIAVLSTYLTRQLYNQEVIVAGWGRNDRNSFPATMQKATLKIMEIEECRSKLSSLAGQPIKLHNRFICSSADPYAIMHYGESGAPVILNGKVVALHRSTMPFLGNILNTQNINIHTSINYYRAFIHDVAIPLFTREL